MKNRLLSFLVSLLLGSMCAPVLHAQIITTYAGNYNSYGYTGDGAAAVTATFNGLSLMTSDATGNLYIVDEGNNAIRMVSTSGIITTVAGGNATPGFGGDNGPAVLALLHSPTGVGIDIFGNLYIADNGNLRVRKVDISGNITTIAGNGLPGYTGDGGPATSATFGCVIDVKGDASGNVFVNDQCNNVIRKIDAAGMITTFAGNGTAGFAGDGGMATLANLNGPAQIAVDLTGNLFIADRNNYVVRMVTPAGIISTVAGSGGSLGYSGDGGFATIAQMEHVSGVAVDGLGNIFVADENLNVVRMVNTAGIISTIAGDNIAGYSGDNGMATNAELHDPQGLGVDNAGNVYMTDVLNNVVRKLAHDFPVAFTGPSVQSLMVCQNVNATDISYLFAINDGDVGQTETWTTVTNPINGTLSGVAQSTLSTGSTVTPTGITYTPNPGYSGADLFTVSVDDGAGGMVIDTILVTVNPLPGLTLGASPVVCAGATSANLAFSGLSNIGPVSLTLVSTGGMQTWAVPMGITNINFDVQGGAGGNDNHSGAPNPGKGGRIQGGLAVSPGQILNIFVGGIGGDGTTAGAIGGFNGGGNATYYPYGTFGTGGAGGGASDIRIGGTGLGNRVVVAGGGGGNGWDNPGGPYAGGDGGNMTGGASQPNVGGSASGGGTQTSGGTAAFLAGWPSGTDGSLGVGGDGSMLGGVAGGGGGGYYGGGGGVWNGGGGGSSYNDPAYTSLVTNTQGYNTGGGLVNIQYLNPGSYSINWDATAAGVGFVNVSNATLPSTGAFAIALPGTAPAAVYSATLTISNSTCTSVSYPITVTVNPVPTVTAVGNQGICNGAMSTAVNFTGTSTAVFNWTNDNTSIGLGASDTGSIPSFVVTDTSTSPVTAHIMVTPTAGGCSGTPVAFNITANPIPALSSTLTPAAVCDNSLFSYVQMSSTGGTTFGWRRDSVVGISNSAFSSSGNINETLVNTTIAQVTVNYIDTLSANGCTSIVTIPLTVNPLPTLSTVLSAPSICDDSEFVYSPASLTAVSAYDWSRNIVTGITNLPATGTNSPDEFLHNIAGVPVVVTYQYTLWAYGCSNTQNVTVTVNSHPVLTSPTTIPAICSGSLLTYLPTSTDTAATFIWNRAPVAGISNAGVYSTGSVSEVLINTTTAPVLVTYNYTVISNGCSSPQMAVTVWVNPTPMLTSASTASAICDGTMFSYNPTSNISTASFNWVRPAVAGVSNGPAIGLGSIGETLNNPTDTPVMVAYIYTLAAGTCTGTDTVWVTVNPTPKMTSTLAAPSICDSAVFNYNGTSNTPGATYIWTRAYVSGIANPPASGTGNPHEALYNSTYVSVSLEYQFTVMANGCTGAANTVHLTVNPTPRMSSPLTATICSGTEFNYNPTSFNTGTTFDWIRPMVPGITIATNAGSGAIHEYLYDNVFAPKTVTYLYRLTANGCVNPNLYSLELTVNGQPPVPVVTTTGGQTLCSNSFNEYFSASTAPLPLEHYNWNVENGDITYLGANNQFALVNFSHSGTAVVTIMATSDKGCESQGSMSLNIETGVADNPQIIFYNGELICLESDEDSYQWGYDDASTLQSSIIPGAVNQSYTINYLDVAHKHYWVLTQHNGCTQKSYYNPPLGVASVNSAEVTDLKVYPNPAMDNVNVEINTSVTGDIQVEVLNLVGQKIYEVPAVDHKATIGVAGLPSGCYIIDCYREGVKIGTSKFIKN